MFSRKNLLAFLILALAVLLVFQPAKVQAATFGDFQYTLDESTREITINGYTGTAADLVIPAVINGYYVTCIGPYACRYNNSITSLGFEVGTKVKSIGFNSFQGCANLAKVALPSTLQKLEYDSFRDCTSLSAIVIPEGTKVETNAFNGCTALSSVTLPSTLQELSNGLFYGCTSLKSISIPQGVTGIGQSCFEKSGLTEIAFPEGTTSVEEACFANCAALIAVQLSPNITYLHSRAFENCSSLTTVNIPADLRRIDGYCFSNCTSLKKLRFGDAVNEIGSAVFSGCTNLNADVVRGTKMETYCINNNIPFTVYATSLGGCTIDGIQNVTYTGEAQTQNLVITCGEDHLEQNTDYTVEYLNNTNAGTATLTIQGTGNYIGTVTKNFRILAEDFGKCKVTLAVKSVVYNTKYHEPAVTVTFNGKKVSGADYKVAYANNRYVGRATVTVSGTGNFINSQTLQFDIVPKGVAIRSLKKGTKSFTVKWKANKIQTTGYEIQYSMKSNFKKAKTLTVSSNSQTSAVISKLKSGKTYYVRIRTYCKVGSESFYSAWSKTKKVKIK